MYSLHNSFFAYYRAEIVGTVWVQEADEKLLRDRAPIEELFDDCQNRFSSPANTAPFDIVEIDFLLI